MNGYGICMSLVGVVLIVDSLGLGIGAGVLFVVLGVALSQRGKK